MKISDEMWSTESPTAMRILAKQKDSFCLTDDYYGVLYYRAFYDLMHPEGYYDCYGDNIPTDAIEKWIEF